MPRVLIGVLIGLLLCCTGVAAEPVPAIIFDTDFGGDADDLGALAMLHNLENAGECELLAVASWSTERYAAAAIHGLNEFYGNGDVPVGVRVGDPWHADWQYSKVVAESLGATVAPAPMPSAVELYREVLADQPEHSVTIVTVGPLANIRNLLASQADDVSPLTGTELVRSRVREFVIMGGKFPEGDWEWNFSGDMPGVTREVLAGLGVPVVFSGYEVGEVIRTGPALEQLGATHPLYVGYRHFSEHAEWMKDRFEGGILDNASFDQTAVLYAVRGGLDKWWTLSPPGRVIADDHGGNRFESRPDGPHRYLQLAGSTESVAAEIRALMLGKDL